MSDTEKTAPARPAKPRLVWLDIAKGIAILLVIVGHTLARESMWRDIIFSFHMPLFFILAGFTFREKPWSKLVVSSAKRLLIPLVLVYCVWWVPAILQGELGDDFLPRALLQILFASGVDVPAVGAPAIGMSWFLVALFVSRLALNGVLKATRSLAHPLPVQGVICTLLAVAGVACFGVFQIIPPLELDMSLYCVLLMWVGYAARQLKLETKPIRPWAVVLVVLLWLVCAHFSTLEIATRLFEHPLLATVGAIAGTLAVCWLSMAIEKAGGVPVLRRLPQFLAFCGRYSMAIFCVHATDFWVPWKTLSLLDGLGPGRLLLSSCFRILYSIAFVQLIRKA